MAVFRCKSCGAALKPVQGKNTVVCEYCGMEQTLTDHVPADTGDGVTTEALLTRAFLALEDEDWRSAVSFCEQVLNRDARNAQAYLARLMAELQCPRREDLKQIPAPFDFSSNYEKAMRFGDEALKQELSECTETIRKRCAEQLYQEACELIADKEATEEELTYMAERLRSIHGYQDAAKKRKECEDLAAAAGKNKILKEGIRLQEEDTIESLTQAIETYGRIPKWRDSGKRAAACRRRLAKKQEEAAQKDRKMMKTVSSVLSVILLLGVSLLFYAKGVLPRREYNSAVSLLKNNDPAAAAPIFAKLDGYQDSEALFSEALEQIAVRSPVAAGRDNTVVIRADGTLAASGSSAGGKNDVEDWEDIVSVACGDDFTIGLRKDGTLISAGSATAAEVDSLEGIVSISAGGHHMTALAQDGTVKAVGYNNKGQCSVEDYDHVLAAAAGGEHTVLLLSDGTAAAVGDKTFGQCSVRDWKDLTAVAAGTRHTVGLRTDGTVVAVGDNTYGQCDVSDWTEIVAIAAGERHTVGLKQDGTLVTAGDNSSGQCDVSIWQDIIGIAAGAEHTAAYTEAGAVFAIGENKDGRCDNIALQMRPCCPLVSFPE